MKRFVPRPRPEPTTSNPALLSRSRLWISLLTALVSALSLSSSIWAMGPRLEWDSHELRQPSADSGIGSIPDKAPPGEYPAGTLIVDFEDAVDDGEIRRFETRYGLDLEPVSRFSRSDRRMRAIVDPRLMERTMRALEQEQAVEVAEPDYTYHAYFEPDDPKYKHQWHMRKIQASLAWDVTAGKGVTVAVIDTGVAYEKHGRFYRVEDLEGAEFVAPYNFVSNNEHANDDHGHGTHVAGTVAQVTNNGLGVVGVAYKSKIMPLKVLDARGAGSVGGIAQAVEYAAAHGAKVINMSLGGPLRSRVLEQACETAKKKGVIVICAAGNSSTRSRQGAIGYPAGYESCVAVSAVRTDDARSWYSSYGKALSIAAPGGDTSVDLDGDGLPDGVMQNTIIPGNIDEQGYMMFQGTSMASPHAAGVAALVMALGVTDPSRVEQILQDTARKPESGYNWDEYGAGIIDAHAAVMLAGFWYDLWRLLLAFFFTALVTGRVRKSAPKGRLLSVGYFMGLTIGCCGLFFLTVINSSWVPFKQYLLVGFPQWSIGLLGAETHMNPWSYSAAFPFAFTVLVLGYKPARRMVAGFSVGVGAHLVFNALYKVGSMTWSLGPDRIWLAGQAALCLILAYLILWIVTQES